MVDQGNHICLVCKPALKCMNLSTGHGIRTAFGRLEPVVQGWLFLNCFPPSQFKSCRTQSRRLSVDFLRLLSTLIHLAIQQTFSVEEGFVFFFLCGKAALSSHCLSKQNSKTCHHFWHNLSWSPTVAVTHLKPSFVFPSVLWQCYFMSLPPHTLSEYISKCEWFCFQCRFLEIK